MKNRDFSIIELNGGLLASIEGLNKVIHMAVLAKPMAHHATAIGTYLFFAFEASANKLLILCL